MGFPVSPQPNPGDTYSVENRVWAYDGYGWRFLGASGSVNVTLSGLNEYTLGNTTPLGPIPGDKWFHHIDGVEYTFIRDISESGHWVEIGLGCPSFGGASAGYTGIDFPTTECVGDYYTYDGRTWIFNGHGWKMTCPYGSEFTFGLTAPFNPKPGHRWADSSSGILFTFVNDFDPFGQTGQWVAFGNSEVIVGPTGPIGIQGIRGPTGFTGPTGSSYLYDLLDIAIDSETDYGPVNDGKFLKFNYSLGKWIMSDVLGLGGAVSFVNSLNGCTGAVGITGTSGEVQVTNSCPNITIGLPDNVSITGNLTVGGLYYGFVDGGTFE